jgi:hypothetical protein
VIKKYGFEASGIETFCDYRKQAVSPVLHLVSEFRLSDQPLENVATAKSRSDPAKAGGGLTR